jgi:hypothetical protein
MSFWTQLKNDDDKIETITLDNAFNNDKIAGILKLSFQACDKLYFF